MTIFTAYQRDPATGQVLFDVNGFPLVVSQPSANTYSQMQARIADEVLGSPTNAQIQNAIQDAIATFERESFWFNDMRYFGDVSGSSSNLTTVLGKEFYSYQDMPTLINWPHMRKILVLAFSNRYPLIERTQQWIDDQSLSTFWQGLPTDFCYIMGSLRLYPIPNGAYDLIVDGTIRFAPLKQAGDTNVWMNEAEPLIRYEAKRLLFTNITRDPEQAAAMSREIYGEPGLGRQGVLAQVRRETTRRAGGAGKLRPSRGFF